MDQINPIFVAVLGVLTLGVLAVLVYRGVFSPRAFAQAPPREGDLGTPDILATAGIFVAGMLAASLVLEALSLIIPDDAQGAMVLGAMVASQAAMLPAIAYAALRGATGVRGGLGTFGFSARHIGGLLAKGLLGGGVMIVLTWAMSILTGWVSTWLGHPPPRIAHEALEAIVEAGPSLVRAGLLISAVIVAPVLEEIIFRGMVQTSLLQSRLRLGRWGVIAVASALFTSVHIGAGAWHALPVLFVLALGLGYAYEKTGSLWPPMVIHAVFNLWNTVLALTVISQG